MPEKIEKKKIDITQQEKDDLVAKATSDLHVTLSDVNEMIGVIKDEKKYDAHLNELREEMKDISGSYKERIEIARAKRNFIIKVLKTRRE